MDPRKYLDRTELAFDLFRIYLGIGLFVRGVLVLGDRSVMLRMLGPEWLAPMLIVHVVVLCHLVGGLLLALGCCTRWAAAVQIPPVFVALFFLHLREGLLARGQSLELAALVLVALVLYAGFGSGPLSVDRYLARSQPRSDPAAVMAAQRDLPNPLSWRLLPPRATPAPPSYEPRGAGLVAVPDSVDAARLYRDVKLELVAVLVWLITLAVLVASSQFVGAVVCFMVGLMVFGIWRVGHVDLE